MRHGGLRRGTLKDVTKLEKKKEKKTGMKRRAGPPLNREPYRFVISQVRQTRSRQPALLLLDEATSAIDPATQERIPPLRTWAMAPWVTSQCFCEESVQDTINNAFPTSTMLAVAHRLETIMEPFSCKRSLHVSKGRTGQVETWGPAGAFP